MISFWTYVEYVFLAIGIIVFSLFIWVFFIDPIINFLQRVYIYYVLKKVRVAHYNSVVCFFLGTILYRFHDKKRVQRTLWT